MSETTRTPPPPPHVLALARARADARGRRDWAQADRLKAEIEAADWRVLDAGTEFRLEPAHPPDEVVDGIRRYGASVSVPSRFGDPDESVATIVVTASEEEAVALGQTVDSLLEHTRPETTIVVVADQPGPALEAALGARVAVGPRLEVVRSSAPLGRAGALNAGLRRATGRIVIWLEPGAVATGDLVSGLSAALDDPATAVAGARGLLSEDLMHYREGRGEVTVVGSGCIGFRRADAARRGPLDERFGSGPLLDAWWSLVLRDAGPGQAPRRALAIAGLPIELAGREGSRRAGAVDSRHAKRNAYRVLDRFRGRDDLGASRA